MSRPSHPRTRKLVLIGGGLLAGMLFTIGALMLPPVQGWIIRRVIALQPGWRFEADRFVAGATGVESNGVVFSMPGLDARAEPLNVRFAPIAFLRHRELQVEEIAARQLRITISPGQLAPSSPAATGPFTGLLASLRAPLPWALLRTALDGRVAILDAGQDVAAGEFKVEGGGVKAGQPGDFKYELTADSVLLPPGPDNKLRSRGVLRIEQDKAHGVGRILLDGDLQLPAYDDIRLPAGTFRLEVSPVAEGERYQGSFTIGGSRAVFTATLDVRRQIVSGEVAFEGGQDLVAALFPNEDPLIAAKGRIGFTTRLATGDTDAHLAGSFTAREWSRYMPELSAMQEFRGEFTGTLERRAGALALKALKLDAQALESPARVSLALAEPLPLPAWPDRALGRLRVEDFPIEWVNPFLEGTDIQVGDAVFAGQWDLHLPPAFEVVRLEPAGPATVRQFKLGGEALPAMPPLTATFSPRILYEIGPETAHVTTEDFLLSAEGGDRLEGAMKFTVPLDETVLMIGSIAGSLPTLLTGAERPLPFQLATDWDATLSADGNTLDLRSFRFELRDGTTPDGSITIKTLQPVRLSLLQVAMDAPSPELLQMKIHRFPLGWVGRWLPEGWQVAGEVAAGESRVRQEKSGEFSLESPVPYSLVDLDVALGGKEMFRGTAQFRPAITTDLKHANARLGQITAQDAHRNRVEGSLDATVGLADDTLAGEVRLEAVLPGLPHSEGTFGELRAKLALKGRRLEGNIFMAEDLTLAVRHAGGALLELTGPEPLLLGFNDKGAFAIGTVAPVSFKTGEIPLAWLRPWAAGQELDGVLEPAEFLFSGEIQTHRIRPVRPVKLRELTFGPAGRPLLRDTTLSLYPALDVELQLHLLPTFQLAYQVDLHGTDGAVEVEGRRALDLDVAVRALGNDQTVLPQRLDAAVRADLGELRHLPGYAEAGWPSSGQLVVRANGDLLGAAPLQVWTRLEGVNTPAGATLAPVELTANGKIQATEKDPAARFDVNVRVLTSPQESDATFAAELKPGTGILTIESSLKSSFLDLRELMRFEEMFAAAEPGLGTPLAPAASPAAADRPGVDPSAPGAASRADSAPPPRGSAVPFWSFLRGRFDLEVDAVRFAPYRIDRLRGRIDAEERELRLSGLAGEMFAGRWAGELKIAHDPEARERAHRLDATFRIEEFESARVVESVFPQDYARVQAKIDLDAKFTSEGDVLGEMIERASGGFTIQGREGLVRLSLPHQEMASSLAILGGTVALSPELRALGRLLRKFAEMPVERIRISGERDAAGEVRLSEFVVDSPQARLRGRGRVAVVPGEPLMNRPLELSVDMAARDELGVILGGMKLLERKPDAAGYRAMRDPFTVGGKAGEPDLVPLYDLLARGVSGSRGTWGFLMRRVQREVEKTRPTGPVPTARPSS